MSLGEAFIEIRADLRPFGRDLQRSVKPIVEAFERELNKATGQAMVSASEEQGRKVGDRLSRGIKNSLTNQFKNKNPFIVIAAALGSALDDGISALPTEVKAAIVAGILLATPVLGAFLTGAVVAATGGAVAALGVGLASQFEEVQAVALATGRNIREVLVESAVQFGPVLIKSLGLVEGRIRGMRDLLESVFDKSSGFVEPLLQGLLDGIQEVLESLDDSLGNIEPFVEELGAGIAIILDSLGQAIEILAASGEDGVVALRDLARIIGVLIVSAAVALRAFTNLYGILRDLVLFLNNYVGVFSTPLQLLARFFEEADRGSSRFRSFLNMVAGSPGAFEGLISATEEETRELKAMSAALEKVSDGVKDQLSLNIDWEESLDRISQALKENGGTIDIRNEKGRENAREFLNALKIAEDQTVELLRVGAINNEQAVAQYDSQVAALKRMATQAGISEQEFNNLYGEIIATGRLRLSAEEMGIESLAQELGKAGGKAQKLLDTLQLIKHLSNTFVGGAFGGIRGFADGGMHYLPEIVKVAEDGPEVTIPLTKPARAAALMEQSGLASMVKGGDGAQVLVFIGNEQLDARMVRVVHRSNSTQAMALNQGPRRF